MSAGPVEGWRQSQYQDDIPALGKHSPKGVMAVAFLFTFLIDFQSLSRESVLSNQAGRKGHMDFSPLSKPCCCFISYNVI